MYFYFKLFPGYYIKNNVKVYLLILWSYVIPESVFAWYIFSWKYLLTCEKKSFIKKKLIDSTRTTVCNAAAYQIFCFALDGIWEISRMDTCHLL